MLFSVRNGLKEDALVDIPNTLSMPQLVLIISLFTLLIGWLIIFAYLALRPMPETDREKMEHPVLQPAITSPRIQTLPIPPRAPSIHPVTQPTPVVTVSTASKREVVLDHSSH